MPAMFNPDGSIVVPRNKALDKDDEEFQKEKVIRITRKAISWSPLTDELDILVSALVPNPSLVDSIFHHARGLFRHMAQLSITELTARHYVVRIVGGQYRDDWIKNFKDYLDQQMGTKLQYWGGSNDYRKGVR